MTYQMKKIRMVAIVAPSVFYSSLYVQTCTYILSLCIYMQVCSNSYPAIRIAFLNNKSKQF